MKTPSPRAPIYLDLCDSPAKDRLELVSAGERAIELVSRPTPLQAKVLQAFDVDTSDSGKAANA